MRLTVGLTGYVARMGAQILNANGLRTLDLG